MSEPAALPDPETLAESLLDAAATGAFDPALASAAAMLDEYDPGLDASTRFRYRVLFFDVAMVSTNDRVKQQRVAIELLAEATVAGGVVWQAVTATSRLDELQRLASTPDTPMELLELLSYAPDDGVRAFALTQLESAGLRALEAGRESREYERLLHAVGASDQAYRLERERKQRAVSNAPTARTSYDDDTRALFRVVAIAGGHAQLRGSATSLLARAGIQIVPIPSSREAVRREKDIVHLVQGCDAVILLVRQITHSTSDQVRKAAERLGVPVIYSNALSAVAIERQLLER